MDTNIPEKPTLETSPNMSSEDRYEALCTYYTKLSEQNSDLAEKLRAVNERQVELKGEIKDRQKRKEALESSCFYLATVKDIQESEEKMIVKQHGNNQQVVVEPEDRVLNLADEGDRVIVDESFYVVDVLDAETGARTQAMEVDDDPSTSYEDIGGLEDVLREVRETVEQPLQMSEKFDEVGIDPPSGVLLYGPPGTGKTMMARAVANQVDASFIRLAGSELVQKFVGEGARMVSDLFEFAEENSPAVIFIDEIDAIASERGAGTTSGDEEVKRTLMQLLACMDGFDDHGDVRVMAATNRYDRLDEAILRPGRFDRRIEVSAPDVGGREEIFNIHLRGMSVSDEISVRELAERTDEMTGADIEHITTEAGMCAVRDNRSTVTRDDFDTAITRVKEDDKNETMSYVY